MRHLVLHGHIFKNAGTTLDWSLRRSFGDCFFEQREAATAREEQYSYLQEVISKRHQLKALSTHHLSLPIPLVKDTVFLPIYLIRHPIDRAHSVYTYERIQRAGTPGAMAAKEKSFAEYIAWRMKPGVSAVIRNYQTHYLSGAPFGKQLAEVNNATFEAAIESLMKAPCIGVVDRYDESMVVFEQKLKKYFSNINLAYVPQNTGSYTYAKEGVDLRVRHTLEQLHDLKEELIENNNFDLALYEMANRKLDTEITSIPEFSEKLKDLRRRCKDITILG